MSGGDGTQAEGDRPFGGEGKDTNEDKDRVAFQVEAEASRSGRGQGRGRVQGPNPSPSPSPSTITIIAIVPHSLALFVIPYSIQPRAPGRCGTDPARFKLLFISRPPSSHKHTSLTSKQQRLRQRERDTDTRHTTPTTHRNVTPKTQTELHLCWRLLAAPTSWPDILWTIRSVLLPPPHQHTTHHTTQTV